MATAERVKRLNELRELVSPRVGVVRRLEPVRPGIEVPEPPVIYRAVLAHFDFQRATLLDRTASGKGETEEEAIAGAIGEAIERYCACHLDPDSFISATFAELATPALDPRSCVLYSEGQYASEGFPYRRFDDRARLAWTPARCLPSSEEILVPASFVYLDYPFSDATEYLATPTSNGLAAGPDLPTAILSGLYELVERDGFLIHWSNQLPAPRVDLSDQGGIVRSILTHFRRCGVEVQVYDVTVDIPIPIMMGLVIDRSGRTPAAAVGLGCNLDPAEALRKALMEACQVYAGEIGKSKFNQPQRRKLVIQDVREPEDHSSYFAQPENLAEFAFLVDGDCVRRIEDQPNRCLGRAPADLDTCVELLGRAGCRVMYVDLTTPDIVPFGLRAVRTIATGLQPMHFGFGQERRGGHRLFDVPLAMGYTSRARLESELNPCPHPLG
jgi:ribosomal protein S12 methylthiotransferase accessory factor